jgi:hypothetical protein
MVVIFVTVIGNVCTNTLGGGGGTCHLDGDNIALNI